MSQFTFLALFYSSQIIKYVLRLVPGTWYLYCTHIVFAFDIVFVLNIVFVLVSIWLVEQSGLVYYWDLTDWVGQKEGMQGQEKKTPN